jgi:predicted glycogen debranching enzyme
MSGARVCLGPEICQDLHTARRREWLETNGLGGFACSTIAGLNTRRYHALLTAALQPPAGRVVLLSKMEETLVAGEERYELGVNEYPGAVHPEGYRYMVSFRLDPYPVFTWRVGDLALEKRLFLVQGEDTVVIEYALSGGPARLELRPLIAFRDYHSLTRANPALRRGVDTDTEGVVSIRPYDGLAALYFAHQGEVTPSGDWYNFFQYAMERERGLDSEEDLFQPFVLSYDLSDGGRATVIASTKASRRAGDATRLRMGEERRRAALTLEAADEFESALRLAADQFLVRRGDGYSIIAGYPWFTDWGRDAMIALPGLTLATGRHEVARGVLAAFAESIDRGMLPNRFPDAGEVPEYNTVDATLWFFEAIRAYEAASGDEGFVRELFPKLKEIIDWHLHGTRYGIAATADGLLRCGEPGVQLTWMDAKIGDWVVTPRAGCPVEIQALWHNALLIAAEMGTRFGDEEFASLARLTAGLARAAFDAAFWDENAGYLADVVEGNQRDMSLRPNQLLAVSLPYPILSDPERARRVVDVVRRELLTPMGLRTLAEYDPAYRPRYEGGVWERDSAYHQGTVWPWLIGPFVDAWLRTGGDAGFARECLTELRAHLCGAGVGQIPEIADASAPHQGRGCFAQAWSVGEVLRAWRAVEGSEAGGGLARPVVASAS